jgi:glycosyltransferase involved in cell wall biosynthesis
MSDYTEVNEHSEDDPQLLAEQVRILRQQVERLTLLVNAQDQTALSVLDYIARSGGLSTLRYWRMAHFFERLARDVLDVLLRRRFRPRLLPLKHLLALDDAGAIWESVGGAPQFLLVGALPYGWAEVTFTAASTSPRMVTLYLDRGIGFHKSDSFPVGIFTSQLKTYRLFVPFNPTLRAARLDPADETGQFEIRELTFKRITRVEMTARAFWQWWSRAGFRVSELFAALRVVLVVFRQNGWVGLKQIFAGQFLRGIDAYELWLQTHALTDERRAQLRAAVDALTYRPTFSILTPTYNTDERWLRAVIESVQAQVYPDWELCLADDASTAPHVRRVIEEYQAKDPRLKAVWREQNGHIAAASNSALSIATGEFVATLDHDDVLTPDALYEAARLLNTHRDADMIYSDEDKISEDGVRHAPYFKPDWSPDLFLAQMYTAHFAVYRRTSVNAIGGFRLGFEGAQDYDLVLRFTEKTARIYHIPTVLYSWRRVAGSTAQHSSAKHYAYTAGQRAMEEALARRGRPATIEPVEGFVGHWRVRWQLAGTPRISIVICTRDRRDLLGKCLTSIFERSSYKNFEVIVVDNGSRSPKTFALLNQWREHEPERFKWETHNIPFNFHKLNNFGASLARGEILIFLNNDIEVITPHWLEELAAQAQRPEIGAVGALLLYPNNTIQHAGIILGINNWAGHSHKTFPADTPGNGGRLLGPSNCSAVTGACLMMRRELFEALGCFDENLEIACGDVELCLKAIETGHYNVVVPHVRLYHHESATRGYEDTPEKLARFEREAAYVKNRWPQMFARDPFYNPNLTRDREDFSIAVSGGEPE